MSFDEKTTPLWKCPRCGHRFVMHNKWHSCSQLELDEHFAGKPPHVRELYAAWLDFVQEHGGPLMVIPQKTRITFQVCVRFGGAIIRRDWVECGLWLKRSVEHPLFRRVERVAARDYIRYFRLTDPAQLDQELAALVKEAYRVGSQEN